VTIVEGDILGLEDRQTYDLIISIDVLEHIQDDVGLLRQFRQALKPGGYLVLHVPRRHQEMWRWLPVFHRHGVNRYTREESTAGGFHKVVIEGHVRDEYTAEELRQVVEEAGFRVMDLRETIGRWGEISFELNNLLWPWPFLRYLLALLTYPIAAPIGYLDIRQQPSRGNSLLITAMRY
jgi:SAM-dependent methyltransferase